MAALTITLPRLRCTRCTYTWVPRKETAPKHCPKCKSPYWDKPRGQKRGPKPRGL